MSHPEILISVPVSPYTITLAKGLERVAGLYGRVLNLQMPRGERMRHVLT